MAMPLAPLSRAAAVRAPPPARARRVAAASTAAGEHAPASAPATSSFAPAGSARGKGSVVAHVATLVAPPAVAADALPPRGPVAPPPPPPPAAGRLRPRFSGAAPSPSPSPPPRPRGRSPPPSIDEADLLPASAFEDDYSFGELLGRGTFGEVRVASPRDGGRQVAVKILDKRVGDADMREAILAEVGFCRVLQACPSVARLVGAYEGPDRVYIATELCCGGDVASLQAASGGRLSEPEAAAVMLAVLRFLAHAHRSGVCYGDVKPENFTLRGLYPSISHLLDPTAPKGRLDVCAVDFGTCQTTEPDVCLSDLPISGTPAYLAPEAFHDCFGMASDVWAAGCMLYHLLSGGFPFWLGSAHQFHGMTSSELRDGILRGSPMFTKDPWGSYSPRVKDLICRMLEKDPNQRITAAGAAAHQWFAEALGDEAAAAAAPRASAR
ncbi:CDPK-related kinase-like [Raphidocelis subcapitata]|uniref:CDPK-related kinase-like n=1 Tax=Raphidocelis subcapitata TaxID=307507 RepID=A0A2V0P5U3_9CHLO|nr:CDPK-related kinase-like [Raphidocelis subcapitata]|eukprot:GBF93233.1 CDPK-related kinase-like [Raphidocelis subcapitata]